MSSRSGVLGKRPQLLALVPFLFAFACQSEQKGDAAMQDPLISALVVLRPASGRKVGGNETITSENVSDYLPDPENVRKTSAYFESVGFDVTSGTGPSFSISGARSVFERAFNQRIKVELKDDVVRSAKSDEGGLVLHLDAIPEDVARQIQEVTFEAPPDFGPFGH